jgi:transcription initiation factor TFIIIB Brf1 subunit/transcription initiation factor TFIIB
MKCEKCNSSNLSVDAEKDIIFCCNCGFNEPVYYEEFEIKRGRE